MSTILVTGGSGFIASRCLLELSAAGHRMRTTVRSLEREGEVRAMLKEGGAEPGDRLSFVKADLASDAGWPEAAAGCDYVLHVASPFPPRSPKHEDDLIVPAREGALRVLRASRDAGVKRIVLTSSFAAIGYGHSFSQNVFDEASWTDPRGKGMAAYVKSKTLAERAAWDFIAGEGGGLELAVAGDCMSILDIAKLLKSRLGASARRVPTLQLPDWLVRVVALGNREARQLLPELGKVKNSTSQKARDLLGWVPRSNEDAILASAESLARLGLVKDSPSKAPEHRAAS